MNNTFESWGEEYDDFGISIEVAVGPEGERREEFFTFSVTSPKRLECLLQRNSVELGRGLIIMRDYNYEIVKTKIVALINSLNGENWNELSMKIAKYARWEYDD
ncbi:Imm8 family immunity protein [Pectinatus frisingensis]|uniref:Imm8 family immunity protein n=1 Tax=Pectinatus frisingensis TaxID=865 RepID=UPI0039BFD101